MAVGRRERGSLGLKTEERRSKSLGAGRKMTRNEYPDRRPGEHRLVFGFESESNIVLDYRCNL